jgi:SAM-dependent methyltransferase
MRDNAASYEIAACSATSLQEKAFHLPHGSTVRISCSSGRHGAADFHRLLELLRLDESDSAEAKSLLNALPPSNWLRRSSSPRAMNGIVPRPMSSAVSTFLRELCAVGLFDVKSLANTKLTNRFWRAVPRNSRWQTFRATLPWAWSAQLAELWSGEQQTHVAIAHINRSGCSPGLAAHLEGMRLALGDSLYNVLAGDGGSGSNVVDAGTSGRSHRSSGSGSSSSGDSAANDEVAVQHVSEQYEALPFPPRRAADERTRLTPIHSSLASLAEVSHFAFQGRFRRRFCGLDRRPFRALVAGAGTGDATVQLAHELAGLHQLWPGCAYNRSEVVHLDLSSASVRLATDRLRVRGLLDGRRSGRSSPSVRLLAASLLSLPGLGIGTFDYINLCGVLHHLPDPAGALAMIQEHALSPGGSIGLMVYGAYGRRGVYETQALLRLLHASGNTTGSGDAGQGRPWPIGARVADAMDLLASLPESSLLRRNTPIWRSDEVQRRMGDAGLFDLLLHSTDQPYTRPRLVAMAKAAGLDASGWLQPGLYDPRYWLRPCSGAFGPCDAGDQPDSPRQLLRQRLASLDVESAAEFAELVSGHARKHWVYLTRSGHADAADLPAGTGMATGSEVDLAPCVLNFSHSTMAALSARKAQAFSVQTLLQGEAMVTRLPPLTSELLAQIDCKTSLAGILGRLTVTAQDAWAQWRQLFDQLNAAGAWLFMTDFHVHQPS